MCNRSIRPAVAALLLGLGSHASAEILINQNFNHRGPAPVNAMYTVPDFEADFPTAAWEVGVTAQRARVVTDRAGVDSPALRVAYPEGTVGPFSNGLSFLAGFPEGKTYEEATASYTVAFDNGFDFQWGGKLPGLVGGGSTATGGVPADGSNGWSARVMFNGQGELYQYVYHVDQPGRYGDWFFWRDENGDRISLERGRPYELKTQIVMNTPNAADGEMRSWLDGVLVLEETDMRFRTTDQLDIDNFYFSSFHGGGTPNWAPDNDSFIIFDDILVTTGALALAPGDHNADQRVDQGDLNLVLNHWGQDTALGMPAGWTASTSSDGRIDQNELNDVLNNWGSSATPSFTGSAIPEPATAAAVAAWAVMTMQRRR
ncbi:MAG: polysaccharide lyase [Planctomycetota bacterium]